MKQQANGLYDIQTLNSREEVFSLDWPGFISSIFCISIYGWGRVQSIDAAILKDTRLYQLEAVGLTIQKEGF